MTNLNIGYSGGSGGFLLLHLLLLSEKYHVSFANNKTFDQAFSQQWTIDALHKWKHTETWPDNPLTFDSTSLLNKIYFFCNPIDITDLTQYPGKTLVIYTDYHSQLLLAYYKKARWYYDTTSSSDFNVPIDLKLSELLSEILSLKWQQFYDDVKDSSWPKCDNFQEICNLPLHIQQELSTDPHFFEAQKLPTINYKTQDVHESIAPILQSADYTIKLQDLLNSNGSILTETLGMPPINSKQQAFLEKWKQLHPPELLSKIGINLYGTT